MEHQRTRPRLRRERVEKDTWSSPWAVIGSAACTAPKEKRERVSSWLKYGRRRH
jgi:hypothetical protein